jgi:putative transposase
MVTGATLHKQHFFKTDENLSLLEHDLLSLARQYEWQLEAWAVFVNHYHFIARAYSDAPALDRFLNHLHSDTARKLNHLEDSAGREVWYNFWDTKLTYERSYLARLNYVHQNAVKHGLAGLSARRPQPQLRPSIVLKLTS